MYSLHYEHILLVDDEEPSRYVKFIEGKVCKFVEMGEDAEIGQFSVIVVDVARAISDEDSVLDVFDTSQKTIDYLDLYRRGCGYMFKDKVVRAMKSYDKWEPNMLILDRLELLPEHRGQGLGLRVLRWLELQFSMGCGIVAMKPFPLQFEGGPPAEKKDDENFIRARLDLFDDRQDVATKKLQKYYGRLGFAKVPGTPFMVADPMRSLPTLEALGLEV